jgi:sulfatase maturation enzyme AslB (radical SAM superfamily)
MGGETLLSPRLEELIDFMIAHDRLDVHFSFVTNGTVYKPELIDKLKKFPRVGIEISIETATERNDYIRQGSSVESVIDNIKKYKKLCHGGDVSVTLRPAISALSVGHYHTLLEFALTEQLLIKSLIVTNPSYLNPGVLPQSVRQQYLIPYVKLLDSLKEVDITVDFNESDPNNYRQSVKQQAQLIVNMMQDDPVKAGMLELTDWCDRWDREFGFNLLELYPEFEKYYEKT